MFIFALSFVVGAVMFVVDVIRFAPARNKIEMISSRLQSLIDQADDISAVEDQEEDEEEPESEPEHVSVFKRKLEEVISDVN
jgi:uncharacterized protein (UPF0305 family)